MTYHKVDTSIINEWTPFFTDPESTQYLGLKSGSAEAQCKAWVDKVMGRYTRDNGLMALRKSGSGELLGMCGVLLQEVDGKEEVEIGYHILKQYRNQGYASEAAREFRVFLFETSLSDQAISIVHCDNQYSAKVAHRNGMLLDSKTTYMGMPVHIYRVRKYLDKVSFGEYLGAGFVIFLLVITVLFAVRYYLGIA